MPHAAPRTDVVDGLAAAGTTGESHWDGWGWIELFVAVQLLWGVFLFIPGAQPYRTLVRAMPYVSSLVALVLSMRYGPRERLSASGRWLLASFALLVMNLLHAETHLKAGLSQVIFQISIAAPMFWTSRMMHSQEQLTRLLRILFAASFLNAALGVLQVYFPE